MSHKRTTTTRRAFLASAPAVAATLVTPAAAAALSGLAPGAAAPSEVDPIFAAIAAHRAACLAFQKASQEDIGVGHYNKATEDASTAAMAHEGKVLAALLACQPTTLAGVAALLDHLNRPEFLIEGRPGTGNTVLAGAFEDLQPALRHLPRRLAATVRIEAGARPARGTPVEPDPIYAAIERHRVALAELDSRCSALDAAKTPEATAELMRLHDVVQDCEIELGEVEPTAITGAVALLRHVADVERQGCLLGEIFDADALADALEKIA
jgi:hypothetical protein